MAPTITTQPHDATVAVGQAATFTVTATGSAPLSYQWQQSGTAITGATGPSYTRTAAAADNGTKFTVVVSNAAGSVTSTPAVLSVLPTLAALQITTTTLPAATVGKAYSTTLAASGGSTPYQWKAGSALPTGLTLSAGGVIAGTPATPGTNSIAATVTDASGATASANLTLTVNAATASTAPFGHVVIVVEENTNASTVIGNSSMPYLNSLMTTYGYATQYYANTHPSIGNYEMLVTGEVLTNDDTKTPASFPISVDNAVRELVRAGKSWKAYAEGLPSTGYTGGDTGEYVVHHVPMAYLTDVQNSATQAQNLVPFSEFSSDLQSGHLPDYSFITPNVCDDAHNCSLAVADTWLQANIAPLMSNPAFTADGLLIITFDESANDDSHGGGRVVAALASPAFSKRSYQSTTFYQHQSVLRLMLEGLGVKTLPGAAASAPTMWEFFTFPAPP